MNNHFILTDDHLWDYTDGFLSDEEQRQVEAYLQQHPEHRARLLAIEAEKRALSALPLAKPQAGFADRVMAAWVAEQAHARAVAPAKPRDWIMLAITGAFGIFLLLALVLAIGAAPETVPTLSIPEQYVPKMPLIDWAGVLGSNIFRYSIMLMLTLLGLQVLDKYLQQSSRLHRVVPGH